MIDTTQGEARVLQRSMSVDLTAMYRQLEEDSIKLINRAGRENWQIEDLIKALEDLI